MKSGISRSKDELVSYRDIYDNIRVSNWFKTLVLQEPLAASVLFSGNISRLTQILGEPIDEIENNNNMFKRWKTDEQGLSFIILSSTNMTYYLIKYHANNNDDSDIDPFVVDDKTGAYLLMFLKKILTHMSKVE